MLSKKTAATLALGGAAALGGGMPALGAAIYDVGLNKTEAYPNNSFVQQVGNGLQRYGDNVDLGPGAPTTLDRVVIPIALHSYAAAPNYTATALTVDLFNVNGSGIPTTIFATSTASRTFTPSNDAANGGGFRPAIYHVTQDVDFLFDNVALPDKFAVGFRDNTPSPNASLSVWLETADSVDTFGSAGFEQDTPFRQFLTEGPTPGVWTLSGDQAFDYNFAMRLNPEPASSVLMLGAGGFLLARRRRRAT